jgi:hypothetical protein
MPFEPPSADTSSDIERTRSSDGAGCHQRRRLRRSPALTQTAIELARAGVRYRYPHASAREQFLRLGIVILGRELAEKAYPEIAQLKDL